MNLPHSDGLPLPSQLIPRKSFRPAGRVLCAEYMTGPPKFPTPGTTSKAQRLGKRYETKVIRKIKKLDIEGFVFGPWISFMSGSGSLRSCQPDMLWFNSRTKKGIIFEIKYTHTIDAYYQLVELYFPVVAKLHPEYEFSLVELTRSYDPAIQFPVPVDSLYFDLEELFATSHTSPQKSVSVLQWKL